MSCCLPWLQCQTCGEEFPIHMITERDDKQYCEKCLKELEEKDKTNDK